MIFITNEDFKAVCDDNALEVIAQADSSNLDRAEGYAIEEISSYLRGRYDVDRAFATSESNRNAQLVMITTDVVLYHLIAWLPKRIGFEIRETRYKSAIAWCEGVQRGVITPLLPGAIGEEASNTIKSGSMHKNIYDY